MYSIDKPGTDVQRESTSSKGDQVQNSNRFAPLQSDDDLFEGSGIQEFDEVEVVEVKKNASKAPELLDEDEDTEADDTDDRENIVDDAMEEDDDDDKRVNTAGANNEAMDDDTLPLTSPKLTATQHSAGTRTLMEPSETTPSRVQRPPTLAERISNLIQVNMEGIPGKSHIFETSFSVDYQGSDSGPVAEALLSTVLNSMEEAINNSPNELKLLPISDTTYKQPNLWIQNSVDLHNRILTYRALSTYCDMEYGNCPYAVTNSKPGEKKLRTRIRVGFSASASVEAVQDYLHTGLRQLGRGAGCYPSRLQYGGIVKIGSCSFIPAEVNFSAYAKEPMRLFDFEVPIGIKMDWVSIPYTGRAKDDERSPGDDWKSAQQGLLSVKAYGPVKDAILTLISKLRDYYILTEVLYPGIDFTGMFKFATTRLYGSSTLFKLLLSIKATPAQADQASTAAKDRPPTTADDHSSEEEDDESQEGAGSLSGPFTKVTKKKVKKKKKKSLISDNLENHFLKDLSPAQRKLAEATNRKLKNDIDCHKAGPLFLMILPGEMEALTSLYAARSTVS
ncbi:unnamed protein product [Cylindrotheca closterium]|uniref:Uncharacterized protein n=1 Tax=Cylindrotheca closterium TaxID=2856 RepID=A0AAD2GF38_9STRA|nr:unnamed protein product [Cylindrotheca closterium]